MLDIKFIRENPHLVKQNNDNRGVMVDIDRLLQLDDEKRKIQGQLQQLQAKRNIKSKIKPSDSEIEEMKQASGQIKQIENNLIIINDELIQLLIMIPNLAHKSVKVSSNEEDNVVMEEVGKTAKFKFKPKDHLELAVKLDLIDMERGAKVAGAKFYFLKNELALMEQALVQYALDIITKMSYMPMMTPDLAKTGIIEKLGYSPRGESTQVYNIKDSDLSLIGTSEITLGAYHADELLEGLPKRYVAVSHCFRTEAGTYSKYSKGIFRVHQFTKVEMFAYTKPDESEKIHNEMLAIQKEIFKGLGIPYRVVDHCTADLGNPSARTFDLEAWLPGKPNKDEGEGGWAEITSCSNCTDYQARGLNIKYKTMDGKDYVHTLNGTGIAVPRAIIAILENYQQADGSVEVPKALRPYLNNLKVIKR
ncbi:MAG: serine--tRNA ligase [bacterium]